jgi:hypothetical protein
VSSFESSEEEVLVNRGDVDLFGDRGKNLILAPGVNLGEESSFSVTVGEAGGDGKGHFS